MVSRVGAGLNDSRAVSRRTVRRAVGLAVAGSVMVTAGLAAWLFSSVGGVVAQSAAGIIRVAGLGLVVAGVLCGLAMILTILGVGPARRTADVSPAVADPDSGAAPATAAPPQVASAAPEPLPERVPLAGRLPSRPDAEPAAPETPPEWMPEPAPELPSRPAAQWSAGPGAAESLPPAPPWTPEPQPERPPQPAPECAYEPAAEQVPEPAPEWVHEPPPEWLPKPAPVPSADQLAGPAGSSPEVTSDEQPAEPAPGRRRSSRKPTVGWNPDSEEDWLRVLRGLRGSVQGPADQPVSRED
jgi:hypothetical protein